MCLHTDGTSSWADQGFIDVLGCLISIYGPGAPLGFYYFGQSRDAFLDSMEAEMVSGVA